MTSLELRNKIEQSKVLLVGAGGIGCEVLKNLTLTGFKNIDAIDLDTIDISNLNRQFLFNKSNVGQSKSEVAITIARREYTPNQENLNFKSMHKSITLTEFDVDFFRQYTFVINALDNNAARSHVNRMCLAAETPLLESGTAGYTGQTKLIKNSLTACHECEGLQSDARTYATCTIRNTPSKPIHCIVWAKHLFHQLFGEPDEDNDVSPHVNQAQSNGSNNNHIKSTDNDEATPEHSINNDTNSAAPPATKTLDTPKKPISTREWVQENNYDSILLFEKLYNYDINYLLSMNDLWVERTKPCPLDYSRLKIEEHEEAHSSKSIRIDNGDLKLSNQRLWSLKECSDIFSESVEKLYKRMQSSGFLHWDKDDEVALNFVVAASNLRSQCFNIERKSPFVVKSLAGNIVPAISSTNSIIGGLLVLQAIRLLKTMPIGEDYRKLEDSVRNDLLKDAGRLVYLNHTSFNRPQLISSFECFPPNPTCLGCSKDNDLPEVEIHLSMKETTLADLVDKIVIGAFHFVVPDLSIGNVIIWCNDEVNSSEDNDIKNKKLIQLPHFNSTKTRLTVEDLLQDKKIIMVLIDEEIDQEKYKTFYAQIDGKMIFD